MRRTDDAMNDTERTRRDVFQGDKPKSVLMELGNQWTPLSGYRIPTDEKATVTSLISQDSVGGRDQPQDHHATSEFPFGASVILVCTEVTPRLALGAKTTAKNLRIS
jgi:hypothetical protein